MPIRDLNALRLDALALSEPERAELARDLVASLDGPEELEAAAAWDREICLRINAIELGQAILFDPEEVISRARDRIRKP